MYLVIIRGPDGSEVTYELGEEEGLIVGRDEQADVVLPSKRVSRRHCRLYTQAGQLFIEDLESQNGVYVGGARVSGTVELRPGPAVEIGEFKLQVKRAGSASGRGAQAEEQDVLRGVGARSGQTLVLKPGTLVVGRDSSADVTIADDSVSRRHAELHHVDGAWVVRDLGSSNGTFVNEQPLPTPTDRTLKAGDRLRFGDTVWQFAPAHAAPSSAAGKLAAAALAAVLVVVAAGAAWLALAPPPVVTLPSDSQVADRLAQAIGRGQAAFESGRYDEARRAFQEALDADPVNDEARLLLRRAELESAQAKLFEEAAAKSSVGRDDEALRLLVRISPDSRLFGRARLRVQELAAEVMRRDGAACRDAAKRRQTDRALETCARYLDFRCHTEPDADALDALRQAEARAGRRTTPWSCPAELAVWFGAGTGAATSDADQKAIAARYEDAAVRDAVLQYAKGELDTAMRALGKARQGKGGAVADRLVEHIATVRARYKEGQSAMLRGSLREAEASLAVALGADEQIVPPELQSFHGREMRSMLGQGFLNLGRSHFDKGAHTEAFEAWTTGLRYARNDGALLDALNQLERVAEGLLQRAQSCDDLQRVLRLTVAEPPSSVHLQARSRLDEQQCP